MPSRTVQLKYLRRILEEHRQTFLLESGSDHFFDHRFYKYNSESIFIVEIDLSGSFRSEYWKSLLCVLQIYYHDLPGYSPPPRDPTGLPIPTYRQARLTLGVERQLDQSSITAGLSNPLLRFDKYIWHVLPDESNVVEVLHDMAVAVRESGFPLASRPSYSRAAMLAIDEKRPLSRR